MEHKDNYTIAEAAELLNCSPATIRRRLKQGKLIANLVDGPFGKQYLIPAVSISPGEATVNLIKTENVLTAGELMQVVLKAMASRDNALERHLATYADLLEQQSEEIRLLREELVSKKKGWWQKTFGKE